MRRDGDEPMGLDDDDTPRRGTPKKSPPVWLWIALGVGGFVLLPMACCGGLFAFGVFKTAQRQVEEENRVAAMTYTPMTVDALIDEWKQNPAVAAKKYEKTGVEVTGTLKEIDSNLVNQAYIELAGSSNEWRRGAHIYVIDKKAKDGLDKCIVGKRVIVKARATGDVHDRPWLRADDIRPAD